MKNQKYDYCLECKKSFAQVQRFENTNLCIECFNKRLNETEQDSFLPHTNSEQEGVNEEELILFVGNNSDYYLKKWKSVKNPEENSTWNWSAFFASIYWLGYRKMYSYALALILILVTAYFLSLFLKINIIVAVSICASILLELEGNSFYYNHAKKKIKQIKLKNLSSENQKVEIVRTGGTSWGGVVVVLFMHMFISFFIFYNY